MLSCACSARIEGPPGNPFSSDLPGAPAAVEGLAGPLNSRLLLGFEYRNAIEDLFGPLAAARANPPADTALNGLTAVGAGTLSLGMSQLEVYETSARAVAEAAVGDPVTRASLLPCEPLGAADAACMAAVAATLGPRVLRQPLSDDALAGWADLGLAAALQEGSFDEGLKWLLTGLLLSPDFLYLSSAGRPHPGDARLSLLTAPELASRLSFFLTGSTPPEWLLLAARRGELEDSEQVAAAARQLLAGPRGDAAVARLFDELFGLEGLSLAAKDNIVYPGWTPGLADSMRAEFLALVGEASRDDGRDLRRLLDQKVAYVDARLAAHYGLPAPQGGGLERVALAPESGRGGLLSLGAFLARHSHPVSSSPTLRGKFVRERLLCQPIDAPPTNVIPSLPPPLPGKPQTTRQRHAEHMQLAGCSGCHTLMDPLGFALEHFDATGAYRDTEVGLPIDATGALDGVPFDGAQQLGAILATDARVQRCLLRTFYRHAVGRLEAAGEEKFLAAQEARFSALGGAIKPWLVELVSSPQFRTGLAASGVTP
jgi:Protein of unknown function (DUF1588)/Protein of unknown function (DUF1592)/Protein of unknown function (DUF1595)/Protein of unknown function (DUF1585)/Protein of unknown function (DUF1587)